MTRNTQPTLATDRRGVSEIIGAIFVFAILIMLLGIIQVWAVPAANEQTEFDHNQRAIGDVQSLAAEVDRAARTGSEGSAKVEAGVRYDTRLFLVNPPAPAGSLRTEETTVRFDNIVAIDSETDDYIDGELELDGRSLAYSPNYHEYRNAPTTRFEWGTVYNQHRDTDIVQGGREPVSGNRISLVALDGRQSTTTGGTVTVPTNPVSAPMRTVSVRGNDSGNPITLTLETGLPEEKWEEILADEIDDGYVTDVSQDGDEVVITLNKDRTYELRLAKVGIGPGTTEEGAHYLTAPNPRPVIDDTGGTVSVEVRDRFNNPVPGVEVTFSAVNNNVTFPSPTVESNEDGVATARYPTPPPDVNRATITATASVNPDKSGENSEAKRRIVEFTNVPVTAAGQRDISDSEINPDDATSFKFVSSKLDGPPKPGYVDVTFKNNGTDRTISSIRVNAFIRNTISGAQGQVPNIVEINGSEHEIGGPYEGPEPQFVTSIDAGEEQTYRFVFRRDSTTQVLNRADFFVYSIQFSDGSTSRYFIQLDVPE